jgi:hypothetical protein
MSQQQPDPDAQMRRQRQQRLEQSAQQLASQQASRHAEKTVKNPDFADSIGDADVDTDLYDWIEAEFGPTFSKAHTHGNFHSDFDLERQILQPNLIERMIAERTPSRPLREDHQLLALAQGVDCDEQHPEPTDHPDFREPLTAAKKRVLREAGRVATVQQSLGAGAKGYDGQTKVQTETRTVSNENSESSSLRERVAGVFR